MYTRYKIVLFVEVKDVPTVSNVNHDTWQEFLTNALHHKVIKATDENYHQVDIGDIKIEKSMM